MPEAPPAPAPELDLSAAGRAEVLPPGAGDREEIAEIITTPPPAVLRTLLYILAGLVAGMLLWSYFSRYDVIIVERGTLGPAAPVGMVQADSTARLERVLLPDGATVSAGQPVLQLSRPGGEPETLAAPIAGTLAGVAERKTGELVAPGQRLAEVVPPGPLLARIQIANQDMGRVQSGHPEVKVKVDAFPYQQYGALEGHLAEIATLPASPSPGAPGDVSGAAGPPAPPGYPATVVLDESDAKYRSLQSRLRPGLALSAEIVVTRRRILDLLLERLRNRGGG
jgi:multidrug efflux pump subunit AcrA (membrane-fusion protein)